MTKIGPIKPLAAAVTKAHKLSFYCNFASRAYVVGSIRKNHKLCHGHGHMKAGSFQNESQGVVFPKKFLAKRNDLCQYGSIFFVSLRLMLRLRNFTILPSCTGYLLRSSSKMGPKASSSFAPSFRQSFRRSVSKADSWKINEDIAFPPYSDYSMAWGGAQGQMRFHLPAAPILLAQKRWNPSPEEGGH